MATGGWRETESIQAVENLYSDVIPPLRVFFRGLDKAKCRTIWPLLPDKRLTPERQPTPKHAVHLTPRAFGRLPDGMAATLSEGNKPNWLVRTRDGTYS